MRVVNIGSLNYDYVYDVNHFVTEGETILCREMNRFLGGKGLNQSLALARAGAEVFHAGAVGEDGGSLLECLSGSGVNVEYVKTYPCQSGHAIIQKSQGKNCIIVYGGANQCVSTDDIERILSGFGDGDMLLLQNEVSNINHAIRQAAERGMKIALNASPVTEKLLEGPLELVDYLIVNEIEGREIAGCCSDDYEKLLNALSEKYPKTCVVLTVGAKGVLCKNRDAILRQDAFKVAVKDTTAAGDTFCGYFLAALLQGTSAKEALWQATAAAAVAVGREGAAASIPWRSELDCI